MPDSLESPRPNLARKAPRTRERAPRLDNKTRRQQIAQAALDLVATRGYRALTVKRLAEKVGLTPSGLYRHFPDKAAILDAILELIGDSMEENVRHAEREGGDAFERLAALLRNQVALVSQRGIGAPRLFFSDDLSVRHPEKQVRLREIIERFTQSAAAFAQDGQRHGLIRDDIPAETLGVMFLGLFQPGTLMNYLHAGEFPMEAQAAKAWRVFAQGMAAPGVTPPPLFRQE